MLLNLFGNNNKRTTKVTIEELTSLRGRVEAINKSQGVIEFNLDGTVTYANQNFLNVIGYSADEAIGKHHSTFVEDSTKNGKNTKHSGQSSIVVNLIPASISPLQKMAVRYGFKQVTIRF